jgi:endonuclease YncB( thermonuclease family)
MNQNLPSPPSISSQIIQRNSLAISELKYSKLLEDLKILAISRTQVVQKQAISQMNLIYWQIGKRIATEKLPQNNNYQNLILVDLSYDLGMEKTILSRCLAFFQTYIEPPQELSWSHYKYLIAIKDDKIRQKLEKRAIKEKLTSANLAATIKRFNDPDQNSNSTLKRPTTPTYLYKAKILNVIDGDTLLLDVDLGFEVWKQQRVRLAQIDCAEMKTLEGKKAFRFVRDKIVDLDFVVIKTNKVDIFGRYVGDIFYDPTSSLNLDEIFLKGVHLNEEIVGKGFARVF